MSNGMFAVHSAWIHGVEARPVTVEISMSDGLPGMSILGLVSADERETCQRVRCAIKACGFENPRKNITVNLSPGGQRKRGSGFDLPIAIAILAATGQIPVANLQNALFVGELSLKGACLAVNGDIAFQLLAKEMRLRFTGGASQRPITLNGANRAYITRLEELRRGMDEIPDYPPFAVSADPGPSVLDYVNVYGQEVAKRAISLAAAGELGLVMVGAPGSGKSMLAERMPGILPELSQQMQQEALCIHSVAGEPVEELLAGIRPFRAPHHSISAAGLVGGGKNVGPGEISLAHGGVLYLDEFAEFPAHVLQALRQPMEKGYVRLVRADSAYTFPCRFQLLAASNPCPCGYLGDKEVTCKCSSVAIANYQSRLGGPLADRIDMRIDIARPDPETLINGEKGLTTDQMREFVLKGRAFAAWRRERGRDRGRAAGGDDVDSAIKGFDFNGKARGCLISIAKLHHLTGRGITRVCRIARTIANTEESEKVLEDHVLEASMFRGRRDE